MKTKKTNNSVVTNVACINQWAYPTMGKVERKCLFLFSNRRKGFQRHKLDFVATWRQDVIKLNHILCISRDLIQLYVVQINVWNKNCFSCWD